MRRHLQSGLIALVFLAGCSAARAARSPQPLTGISLPPTSTSTASSTSTRTPPGAAEAQATASPGDDRAHVANAVARASAQIDRLRRMRRAPAGENRASLDDMLDDLERARRNVLQDLREVELEPSGVVIRRQLQDDLADLQSALEVSYAEWPPTGRR